jgi:hypothetical protein
MLPLPRFWRILFGVVFGAFLLVYFTNAMAPERSADGSTYHLGLVARYMREHGFQRLTTNMYGNLSQGVEMLFLFAYAFGRHSAAALAHFAFLATLPLAMLAYAKRFGFPGAGAAGALIFFVSPVVGMDGSTAYVDVAVAAVLFAVFYLLQIWDQSRDNALLIPIGLLAGFGYAAKYTAFLAVPYALGFVAWKLIRARRPLVKPLVVLTCCAVLMIAPWVLKNWIWLDNPFSPFLNTVFPNPYVHVSMEKDYTGYLRHYEGLKSGWQIIPEVTLRGRALSGLLGPVFLLAPLALIALREQAGRRLLAAGLIFGVTYFFNIGTRFLIPAAPFFSLAMMLAVARSRGMAPLLVIAHALASWPTHIKAYSDVNAWKIERPLPWKQALRIESEEAWLTRVMPSYLVARMIQDFVPPGERVFAPNQVAEAYTSRDVLVGYQAAFNQVLGDTLLVPIIEDYRPRWHAVFRFPRERLRALRVTQTAGSRPDQWSVNEVSVLDGDREIRRTPAWRIRAHPNSWEADLAFDRNLATRWRSWQNLFPGMFLEAGFGAPEPVDAVRLEGPRTLHDDQMELEGLTERGQWKKLGGQPERIVVDEPAGVRRAAVAAFLERKVQWFVIDDSDYGADDLKTKTADWGITFVAARNTTRLFRGQATQSLNYFPK